MKKEDKKEMPANYLSNDEKDKYQFVKDRIIQLQGVRKDVYGVDLEKIWKEADKDYVPHRLNAQEKKMLVQDEDKGWRGSSAYTKLGKSNWQSDISKPNIFLKIQTALAILIDKNPTGKFSPTSKKYQNTTFLMENLHLRSWEVAKSKQQL